MENLQRNPQRLSALYQYHNAPEVAPAHGLEYDETVHSACSDKYPVIQPNRNYVSPQGSKIYDNDHPPRIIFGMKIRTFLLVAAFMVLVVIGAAVGGAVGGKGGHENMATGEWPTDNENNDGVNDTSNINDDNNSTNTSTSSSPPSATVSAAAGTYSGPVPTYQPLNACPDANNTSYTSNYTSNYDSSDSSDSGNTANLTFALHCDRESPLSGNSDSSTLSQTFVYSLADCIELCASLNFWAGNADCSFAAYEAKGSRPGNCWVGKADGLKVGALKEKDGMAVAVLGA